MNGSPKQDLRKELIEDYFLEITDLIGNENLRTEIQFDGNEDYSASLHLDVSSITDEQTLTHFMAGLKSIIRRINIVEKNVKINLTVGLTSSHQSS